MAGAPPGRELPVAVTLTVVDVTQSCQPLAGARVEIWHCDKDGVYSEYGGQPNVPDQTGTTFLLAADGLYLIRRPAVEEEYEIHQWQLSHPG